jgi:transglutaminase-like putative cysteine protease
MRIKLSHVTRLDYSSDVVEGVMDVRLGPLTDADQRVETFALAVMPSAAVRRYTDGFGNAAHLVTLAKPHRLLEVTAASEVTTLLDDPFMEPRRTPRALGPSDLADYLSPSTLVPGLPALSELAAPFRPATPAETFAAVRQLSHFVHTTFSYRRHVTTVTTTVADVVTLRTGVCQDFAHVLIGLCRALDIPARYISGYTVAEGATDRSPRPDPEASHAWVEAFTPTHGWRGFDPTNDLVASTAHIKMAIGRDYADVPPTRGTFRGAAEERLTVRVASRPSE